MMSSFRFPSIVASLLLVSQACLTYCSSLPPGFLDTGLDDQLHNNTLTSRDIPHTKKRNLSTDEKKRLSDLSDSYKGIFWEVAYPGAGNEDGGCTIEEFNILAEATRMAIHLGDFSGADLWHKDSSFNKFFVDGAKPPNGGKWTSTPGRNKRYTNLHHNLLQPSRFPRTGGHPWFHTRDNRVVYRCKDYTPLPPNSKPCNPGKGAYTIPHQWTKNGWTIVFCPLFFEKGPGKPGRYLNEVTGGDRHDVGDLGIFDIYTYEQVMLHEWMHADIFGFSNHLIDALATLPGRPERKMYGAKNAADYAWMLMGSDPDPPSINTGTVYNVENYVWYYVHKYYTRAWGWTDKGDNYPDVSPAKKDPRKDEMLDIFEGEEGVDPNTLPEDYSPDLPNCRSITDPDGDANVECDPIAQEGPPAPVAPTREVDGGTVTCGTRDDMDNADYWRDLETLNSNVESFCKGLAGSRPSITFDPSQESFDNGITRDHYSSPLPDSGIHAEIKYGGLGKPECRSIIWSGMGQSYCIQMFGSIINNCDTDSKGHKLWKQGGSYVKDCITYNISVKK